jgi:hypothetical protein
MLNSRGDVDCDHHVLKGENSTYTWKSHVKWFHRRKAKAVVWLMRRATRALARCRESIQAESALLLLGKRAKAFAFLIEKGIF